MKTRSKIHGFTLIELLTVIAIIGILAAIIIPTVGRVRESAKRAKCMSNVRQISLALVNSANQDRWQNFPSNADNATNGSGGAWAWDVKHVLSKDVVNQAGREVFYCPSSAMLANNTIQALWDFQNQTVFAVTSYVVLVTGTKQIFAENLNTKIQSAYDMSTPSGGTEQVPASRRPLVLDAVISSGTALSDFANVSGGFPSNVSNHMNGAIPLGAHIGYVDAHVKWTNFALASSTNPDGYKIRNSGANPKFWW